MQARAEPAERRGVQQLRAREPVGVVGDRQRARERLGAVPVACVDRSARGTAPAITASREVGQRAMTCA